MTLYIFALAIFLRFAHLTVPPLWYDENFTLIAARLPFDQMLAVVMGDVHPPLWYVIEWMIVHALPGAPAWVIRIPSVIFSIASLFVFNTLTRRLALPYPVRMGALVLMAVLPFQLWYAQEGRMYAFLEFLVLGTLLAALDKKYVLVFIGSLAMLYTQNYGAFYMAAILLAVLVRENWLTLYKSDVNWTITSMMLAGALWLPWLRVVTNQMQEIEGRYWILDQSAGGVLIILYKMFFTAAVPAEFFFASYLVTFVALIVGLWIFIRSAHPTKWTVLIMAFAPLGVAWIASLVWQPVLLFRALIGISPFLYIIVCYPLAMERKRNG